MNYEANYLPRYSRNMTTVGNSTISMTAMTTTSIMVVRSWCGCGRDVVVVVVWSWRGCGVAWRGVVVVVVW